MDYRRLIGLTVSSVALIGAGCAERGSHRAGPDSSAATKVQRSPLSDRPLPSGGLTYTIPGSLLDAAQSHPILESSASGVLRVEWDAPDQFARTGGYCMGIVHTFKDKQAIDLSSGRLIPGRVSQLDDQGAFPGLFALEVRPDLPEPIRPAKDRLILFTPDDASAEQIRSLPAMVRFEHSSLVAYEEAVKRRDAITVRYRGQEADRKTSTDNLKRIGLAMHNYQSANGHFPPAVIDGPDGRPWHSWRVLILPYLEEAPLYNSYNFDQPWDGPENKRLLDKMPDVYRKPGERSHFTRYVVPRGPSTIFPTTGARRPGDTNNKQLYDEKDGGFTFLRNVTDGTSNTILAGAVDPDRKIEWTRPEDLDYPYIGPGNLGLQAVSGVAASRYLIVAGGAGPGTRPLASLHNPDGFATPYISDAGPYGVFLFADGSVKVLHKSLSDQTFTALLTRNGGEVISSDSFGDAKTGHSPTEKLPGFKLAIRPVGADAVAKLEEISASAGVHPSEPSKPDRKGESEPAKTKR